MQRHFYASPSDLVAIVETVERKLLLQYTPMGMFQEPPSALLALNSQLIANVAKPDNSYLVTYRGTEVRTRSIPQVAGGILYAVDQLVNPDSIALTSSAWQSPRLAVYGRIGTVSGTKPAKCIYGAFARAIERLFRRVNSAWVGSEAEAAWRAGARLAIGPSSPREYDLTESKTDAV